MFFGMSKTVFRLPRFGDAAGAAHTNIHYLMRRQVSLEKVSDFGVNGCELEA